MEVRMRVKTRTFWPPIPYRVLGRKRNDQSIRESRRIRIEAIISQMIMNYGRRLCKTSLGFDTNILL